MARTYTPLHWSGPTVIAGLVMLTGHVIGPAIGTILARIAASKSFDVLADFPTEGEAP